MDQTLGGLVSFPIPSLKLPFSPLTSNDWKNKNPFWDGPIFGAMLVLGSIYSVVRVIV